MPAIGTITVNDGETTPVAHAFEPVKIDGNRALYRCIGSATTPLGYETLVIEQIEPKSAGQAFVTRITGYDPVTATVDGNDVIARYNSWELKINSSALSTTQERKNDRVMISNVLKDATVVAAIDSLASIY